jgi:hypothetical protein
MATVRQVRRGLFLTLWFLFSIVARVWPSRLSPRRPTSDPRVEPAIMLRLPSLAQQVGYGLELGLRPPRAQLVRFSLASAAPRLSPGAFVSRMPKAQVAVQNAKPAQGALLRTTGTTRTHTRTTTGGTTCTMPPPPPPPPTTTVPTATVPPPGPACSRTTQNTVCARVGPTSYCAIRDCCWSNDQSLGCVTVSNYTVKNTGVTGTTFPTHTGTTGPSCTTWHVVCC